MKLRLYVLLLLSALCRVGAAGGADVAVVESPEASAKLMAEARRKPRCYVGDLSKGDKGDVFTGKRSLPAGRYRLRALIAAAPLHDLGTGAVRVRLAAGEEAREMSLGLLPDSDEFVPVSLAFASGGGKTPIAIRWLVAESKFHKDLNAKRALHVKQGGKGGGKLAPPALFDEEPELDIAGELDRNRLMSMARARETRFRLLACGLHIERLSPLEVVEVWPAKLVFKPAETLACRLTLKNHGRTDATATLALDCLSGLTESRRVHEQQVRLGAGETRVVELEDLLPLKGMRWGAELRATLSMAGAPDAVGGGMFAVTDNFWDVHQYTFTGGTAEFSRPGRARRQVLQWRREGYTAIEALFWAPDDMFDFTPDEEDFFGGQGGYPGTISGTKAIVDLLHEHGMSMTFYANWWGGGGPPAMEMMRRHPEWFANANYQTFTLDDWPRLGYWGNMKRAKVRAPGIEWAYAPMYLVPFDGAFEKHAEEIIGSIKMFGWDAIRYDSAYSRAWNVRGMRLVRERVSEVFPDFRYGMNSFALGDARALQLPNFRGGCVMGEGLRLERKKVIARWARQLLDWRDVCWPYDVQVMPLYRQSTDEEAETPLDSVLSISAHYACGGHIGASPPVTDLGNLAPFSLRWSEFLWDTRMLEPGEPESLVQLTGKVLPTLWQRMVRVVPLGEDRYRVVMQLLNVPEDYAIFRGYEITAPAPLRDLKATLNLPRGAKVETVRVLCPYTEPWVQEPTHRIDAATLQVEVPEVRFWKTLVVEFSSPAAPATKPTLKEKTDSYVRRWLVLGPFKGNEELKGYEEAGVVRPPVDLTKAYEGLDERKVSWRPFPRGDARLEPSRSVNMKQALDCPRTNFIYGYAFTKVISDRARDVMICGKADDALAVWLNGEQVMARRMDEFQKTNEVCVKARLREGENRLLVRTSEKWLYWQFVLRIADERGRPISDGITYSTEIAE